MAGQTEAPRIDIGTFEAQKNISRRAAIGKMGGIALTLLGAGTTELFFTSCENSIPAYSFSSGELPPRPGSRLQLYADRNGQLMQPDLILQNGAFNYIANGIGFESVWKPGSVFAWEERLPAPPPPPPNPIPTEDLQDYYKYNYKPVMTNFLVTDQQLTKQVLKLTSNQTSKAMNNVLKRLVFQVIQLNEAWDSNGQPVNTIDIEGGVSLQLVQINQ